MEHKISLPQWEKDWNLQPMNLHGLMDEYLEMGEHVSGGVSLLKNYVAHSQIWVFPFLTIDMPV